MTDNATTENNGGFIQIRVAIGPSIASNNFSGIYIADIAIFEIGFY